MLREAEDVAGVGFGESGHGFLEGGLEDSTGHMDAISLFSTSQQARKSRRSSCNAHPGAAGESHKFEVRRKKVQGADGTFNHVTIDLCFDVIFWLLLVS